MGKNTGEWNLLRYKEPPKEEAYLTYSHITGMAIYKWAENLYEVDDYDFDNEDGTSGFYGYDSEYGYYKPLYIDAWMELPAIPEIEEVE